MKTKFKIEEVFGIISGLIIILLIFSLKTGLTDNYFHYLVAKQIIKTPEMLYKQLPENHPARLYTTPWFGGNSVYFYPPLIHLLLAGLFLLNLGPELLFVINVAVLLIITYKICPEAIPFLYISFMFVRVVVQGSNDVLITALALSSFYFFDKKPVLSGFLAGLCPLVKGTGFLFLGSYILGIIITKNKLLFSKNYLLVFLVIFLTLLPWYGRNFILTNGDLFNTFIGQNSEEVKTGEAQLSVGTQSLEPERSIIDKSGFYPLPIDLLFYVGLVFTLVNITKAKKVKLEYIIIVIYFLTYFIANITGQTWLSVWRYYLPIFPLLAIETGKFIYNLDDKKKFILYIICAVLFIVWVIYLPKYSFNGHWAGVYAVCNKFNYIAGSGFVYVKSYNSWFVTYACNFNATTEKYADWVIVVNDFPDVLEIYKNKTNK